MNYQTETMYKFLHDNQLICMGLHVFARDKGMSKGKLQSLINYMVTEQLKKELERTEKIYGDLLLHDLRQISFTEIADAFWNEAHKAAAPDVTDQESGYMD
jgi:hypothetical protein